MRIKSVISKSSFLIARLLQSTSTTSQEHDRLKTVEKCDQIFFIDEGKVADQGTFQELIEKNKKFKNMANHT